jgi:hypothetical protein
VQSAAITFFGQRLTATCDQRCSEAFGINWHGSKNLPAPEDPGTYEGGDAKPLDAKFNRWCVRECERCQISS